MPIAGPEVDRIAVRKRPRISVSNEFAHFCAKLFRDNDISRAEVARRMNVQKETLYKYTLGLRSPTPELVVRMCHALKLGPKERFAMNLAAARSYGYILPPAQFLHKGDAYVQKELERLHR